MTSLAVPRVWSPWLTSAAVSAAVLVPLVWLNFVTGPITGRRVLDAAVLFGLLWFLGFVSVRTAITLGRGVARDAGTFTAWASLAVLLASAAFWVLIVRDQLPCFLGVPNCD